MSGVGRLPSLQSLRTFEAVARHGSFLKAADELCVTATAVSHQIKALEQALGVMLFKRLNRGVELTQAGHTMAPKLSYAFTMIGEAVRSVRWLDDGKELRISVSPSLATKWLMPRLGVFRNLHPSFEIRLSSTSNLADLSDNGCDLAFRHGSGTYPGCHSEFLLSASVLPVCSPRLLAGGGGFRSAADISRFALLHDMSSESAGRLPGWPAWFRAAGIDPTGSNLGPRFNHSYLTIEAAIAGEGVALAVAALAAQDIAAGRLIVPFELSLEAPSAYYIVTRSNCRLRPQAEIFRRWMRDEAAKSMVGGVGRLMLIS
jgi:LysR family glycine cleavage system transcriptional activator